MDEVEDRLSSFLEVLSAPKVEKEKKKEGKKEDKDAYQITSLLKTVLENEVSGGNNAHNLLLKVVKRVIAINEGLSSAPEEQFSDRIAFVQKFFEKLEKKYKKEKAEGVFEIGEVTLKPTAVSVAVETSLMMVFTLIETTVPTQPHVCSTILSLANNALTKFPPLSLVTLRHRNLNLESWAGLFVNFLKSVVGNSNPGVTYDVKTRALAAATLVGFVVARGSLQDLLNTVSVLLKLQEECGTQEAALKQLTAFIQLMQGKVLELVSQGARPMLSRERCSGNLTIEADGLTVACRNGDTGVVFADRTIDPSLPINYFEVTLLSVDNSNSICVGWAPSTHQLGNQLGSTNDTYAYYSISGKKKTRNTAENYGPVCAVGDVIGCGINTLTNQLFFTRNGIYLGVAYTLPLNFAEGNGVDLYPALGMSTSQHKARLTFEPPFVFKAKGIPNRPAKGAEYKEQDAYFTSVDDIVAKPPTNFEEVAATLLRLSCYINPAMNRHTAYCIEPSTATFEQAALILRNVRDRATAQGASPTATTLWRIVVALLRLLHYNLDAVMAQQIEPKQLGLDVPGKGESSRLTEDLSEQLNNYLRDAEKPPASCPADLWSMVQGESVAILTNGFNIFYTQSQLLDLVADHMHHTLLDKNYPATHPLTRCLFDRFLEYNVFHSTLESLTSGSDAASAEGTIHRLIETAIAITMHSTLADIEAATNEGPAPPPPASVPAPPQLRLLKSMQNFLLAKQQVEAAAVAAALPPPADKNAPPPVVMAPSDSLVSRLINFYTEQVLGQSRVVLKHALSRVAASARLVALLEQSVVVLLPSLTTSLAMANVPTPSPAQLLQHADLVLTVLRFSRQLTYELSVVDVKPVEGQPPAPLPKKLPSHLHWLGELEKCLVFLMLKYATIPSAAADQQERQYASWLDSSLFAAGFIRTPAEESNDEKSFLTELIEGRDRGQAFDRKMTGKDASNNSKGRGFLTASAAMFMRVINSQAADRVVRAVAAALLYHTRLVGQAQKFLETEEEDEAPQALRQVYRVAHRFKRWMQQQQQERLAGLEADDSPQDMYEVIAGEVLPKIAFLLTVPPSSLTPTTLSNSGREREGLLTKSGEQKQQLMFGALRKSSHQLQFAPQMTGKPLDEQLVAFLQTPPTVSPLVIETLLNRRAMRAAARELGFISFSNLLKIASEPPSPASPPARQAWLLQVVLKQLGRYLQQTDRAAQHTSALKHYLHDLAGCGHELAERVAVAFYELVRLVVPLIIGGPDLDEETQLLAISIFSTQFSTPSDHNLLQEVDMLGCLANNILFGPSRPQLDTSSLMRTAWNIFQVLGVQAAQSTNPISSGLVDRLMSLIETEIARETYALPQEKKEGAPPPPPGPAFGHMLVHLLVFVHSIVGTPGAARHLSHPRWSYLLAQLMLRASSLAQQQQHKSRALELVYMQHLTTRLLREVLPLQNPEAVATYLPAEEKDKLTAQPLDIPYILHLIGASLIADPNAPPAAGGVAASVPVHPALADELINLLRCLLVSTQWSAHVCQKINDTLLNMPLLIAALKSGAPIQPATETQIQLAMAALGVLGGHLDRARVGGRVELMADGEVKVSGRGTILSPPNIEDQLSVLMDGSKSDVKIKLDAVKLMSEKPASPKDFPLTRETLQTFMLFFDDSLAPANAPGASDGSSSSSGGDVTMGDAGVSESHRLLYHQLKTQAVKAIYSLIHHTPNVLPFLAEIMASFLRLALAAGSIRLEPIADLEKRITNYPYAAKKNTPAAAAPPSPPPPAAAPQPQPETPKPSKSTTESRADQLREQYAQELHEMLGYPKAWVLKALQVCRNNKEAAVNWILENPQLLPAEEEEPAAPPAPEAPAADADATAAAAAAAAAASGGASPAAGAPASTADEKGKGKEEKPIPAAKELSDQEVWDKWDFFGRTYLDWSDPPTEEPYPDDGKPKDKIVDLRNLSCVYSRYGFVHLLSRWVHGHLKGGAGMPAELVPPPPAVVPREDLLKFIHGSKTTFEHQLKSVVVHMLQLESNSTHPSSGSAVSQQQPDQAGGTIHQLLTRELISLLEQQLGEEAKRDLLLVEESEHNYADNMKFSKDVQLPGARCIVITFDSQCRTENNCDWLSFFKYDRDGRKIQLAKYSGAPENFKTVTVDDDRFHFTFTSDGSTNDWGYKFWARGLVRLAKLDMALWLAESLMAQPGPFYTAHVFNMLVRCLRTCSQEAYVLQLLRVITQLLQGVLNNMGPANDIQNIVPVARLDFLKEIMSVHNQKEKKSKSMYSCFLQAAAQLLLIQKKFKKRFADAVRDPASWLTTGADCEPLNAQGQFATTRIETLPIAPHAAVFLGPSDVAVPERPIPLGDKWTLSLLFQTPLPLASSPANFATLTWGHGMRHVAVRKRPAGEGEAQPGLELGIEEEGIFKALQNVNLAQLSEGWHHLAVTARRAPEISVERSRNIHIEEEAGVKLIASAPPNFEGVGMVVGSRALSRDTEHNPYFEIQVLTTGKTKTLYIGVMPANYPTICHPGFIKGSLAYHNDGKKWTGELAGADLGPAWGQGDVVGCGLDNKAMQLYFTVNGKRVGECQLGNTYDSSIDLFPVVGLRGSTDKVKLSFNPPFRFATINEKGVQPLPPAEASFYIDGRLVETVPISRPNFEIHSIGNALTNGEPFGFVGQLQIYPNTVVSHNDLHKTLFRAFGYDRLISGSRPATLEHINGHCQINGYKITYNSGMPTVRATCAAATGRWYYEVKVLKPEAAQIGWANNLLTVSPRNGVGDDENSWAWDGKRVLKWNNGRAPFGKAWKEFDIVGCLLDLDKRECSFSLNGEHLGVAFEGISVAEGVYPAISLAAKGSMLWLNLGQEPFKYQPAGYLPWSILSIAGDGDAFLSPLIELDTLLDHFNTDHHNVAVAIHPSHPPIHKPKSAPPAGLTPLTSFILAKLERTGGLTPAILHAMQNDGWVFEKDMQLVELAQDICEKQQVRNTPELSMDHIKELTESELVTYPLLKGLSTQQIRARYALLKLFNAAVESQMNWFDMSNTEEYSIASKLQAVKRLVFTSVKMRWLRAMLEASKNSTNEVPLSINRPKAARHLNDARSEGRYSIFAQAMFALQSKPNAMKCGHGVRAFKVTLQGEGAVDQGGPYRELIAAMCTELQSQALPLMCPCPNATSGVGDNQDGWMPRHSATSSTCMQLYEFLGKLLGMALRTGVVLELNLPSLFWKPLVGQAINEGDLEAVDVQAVRFVRMLRGFTDEESFRESIGSELFFTTSLADGTVVDLKEGGASVPVTFENREEYATEVLRARLHETQKQMEWVYNGLTTILNPHLLRLLTWDELQLAVCGKRDFDIENLKKHTEFSGVDREDALVKMFWEVLKSFTAKERSLFLRFVWGQPRLPVDDANYKFKITLLDTRGARGPDAMMPMASTCYFTLKLPRYTSVEAMKKKLLYAITNCFMIDTDNTPDAQYFQEEEDEFA